MKRLFIFTGMFASLFLWSCEEVKDWSDPTDDTPPGIVTEVQVENIHGGAIITYKLPADDDLLAVKAVYSFDENDKKREAFSSANNNTIKLEGYPEAKEQTVYLYAVDKSRNESSPVEVKISPLTPPVQMIRQSLRVNSTFGGLYALWENMQEDEISLSLYTKNDNDEFQFYDACYTKITEGKFTFRGLKDIPQYFRIEIRDKWGNYSLPLDTVITPLFEEEIVGRDQAGYIWQRWGFDDRTCLFRGDIVGQEAAANRQFYWIHDGNTWNNSQWWHTIANKLNDFVDWPVENYKVTPFYFTIDMGREASYSRFRYWMRSRAPIFSAQTFISLEVWGCDNPKALSEIGDGSKEQNLMYWTDWAEVNGSGEWRNDWTKLTDFVLQLPSGANHPDFLTDEDKEFVKAGFEVEIDPQYADTPFRYLRFVIRESREPSDQVQLSELKFWGAYKD